MNGITGYIMKGKDDVAMQAKRIELHWKMLQSIGGDCQDRAERPWHPVSGESCDQTPADGIPACYEHAVVVGVNEEDYS
ncbi:hypothetical protein [Methanoregula sp.]|uniref:hypothetical protein n=1 Tax=Methanoregula sp. TaxID=2052170 RepID=UPI000CB8482B|nr:hypothetical protein [Methanoregula sp.]PKG32659.1 MAG: hypothetical protein CW742_07000 [Methanoregula sp.]